MKSTTNNKTNEVGIISFDDTLLFNYKGLSKIGLNNSYVDDIHMHLLRCHNIRSAPDGYFFTDSIFAIQRETRKFIKHGVEPRPKFKLRPLWNTLEQILDERHCRKNLKRSMITDYRFCGFFTARAFNADFEPDKKDYMALHSTGLAYINRELILDEFHCYISEKDFDLNETFHLPKDRERSTQPWQQRIENEVYFEKDDLQWLLSRHYRSENIDFYSIKPDQIYKNGKLLTPKPIQHLPKSEQLSDLTRDTYTRIIAGLFEISKNPNRPRFKDDRAIYNHLKKHFSGVKGLTENTINKFIAAAKSDLDDRQRQVGDKLTYSERTKA